jgi:hypothetical protein
MARSLNSGSATRTIGFHQTGSGVGSWIENYSECQTPSLHPELRTPNPPSLFSYHTSPGRMLEMPVNTALAPQSPPVPLELPPSQLSQRPPSYRTFVTQSPPLPPLTPLQFTSQGASADRWATPSLRSTLDFADPVKEDGDASRSGNKNAKHAISGVDAGLASTYVTSDRA